MQRNAGLREVFARAWVLLRSNVIIILPPVMLGVLSAAADLALSRDGLLGWQFFGDLNAQGSGAFWAFFATIVALGLRILAAVVAMTFTTGMAGAAWRSGTTSLRDGVAALRRDGVQALLAMLVLLLMGFGAAALAVPTFGLSVIAYMVFAIYTMPAVLVGHLAAADAIVESMRMTWCNFRVTIAVVGVIVVLAVAGGVLGSFLDRVPLLGAALDWVGMEVVVAYATLVVVGEYLRLQRPADQAA